jgi:hypothetical protein
LANECGYIFATPAWLESVKPSLFGIFDKNSRMIGGFVAAESRIGRWSILRTPRYYPTVGPFFLCEASNPAKLVEARRRIFWEIMNFIDNLGPVALSLSLDRQHTDVLPFIWRGCKATPGYTYTLNLEKGEERLLSAMSPKRRSELRKSEKDGVIVEETRDLDCVERIVSLTFSRQHKRYPAKLLHELLSRLAGETSWYAVLARVNNSVASVAFCQYSQSTSYYLFGGYDASLRSAQAGSATLWKTIQIAIEKGLTSFDFEGSMNPAIERFYSDFGGDLQHYFRISRAWWLIECGLKLKWRDCF